jgi:hypothetical protein
MFPDPATVGEADHAGGAAGGVLGGGEDAAGF